MIAAGVEGGWARMDGVTQSVELLLDDELDAAVRREWGLLLAADLPSQGRHTGETNRPHVTLTVAGSVLPYIETAIKAELTGRLPVPIRLGGLLCFGGRGGRYLLARSVVPNPELLELQAACAALFDGLPGVSPLLQPGSWTPHVTLARNVPGEWVGTAIGVIGEISELAGAAETVRRWDSEGRTAWRVG
jgi:2'-5' RNA ligase